MKSLRHTEQQRIYDVTDCASVEGGGSTDKAVQDGEMIFIEVIQIVERKGFNVTQQVRSKRGN